MTQNCNEPGPIKDIVTDLPPGYCEGGNGLKDVAQGFNSWTEEPTLKKTGLGHNAQCDPIQTGQIINDLNEPANRTTNVIYRYAKTLRASDEAMQDLFRNLVVLDEEGKAHPVPIIIGTQERAVAFVLQNNMRKDNSLVVDRLRLPLLAINNSGIEFNQNKFVYQRALDYGLINNKPGYYTSEQFNRDTVFGFTRGLPININYTLYAWSKYMEDMNQIVEQILLKFSPIAYIRIRSVPWETIVKLNSLGNNINFEPGDQVNRVIKYQFDLTVETFLPQPIVRKKAVLKTQIDFVTQQDGKITEVLSKQEESVKGEECI